jgi:CubicO group peptidase (beta-lactamase class C family)
VAPGFSDEPTHDDDHLGESHPEVDDSTLSLRTPSKLFVGVVPGIGVRSTTHRCVAASGAACPSGRFYVKGPAYCGLVGGVDEAARLIVLHLNGGQADGRRLLSEESVAEMQLITPRGGKRNIGLGWFRSHEARGRNPSFVEYLGGGAGFWNVMRIYPEESLASW